MRNNPKQWVYNNTCLPCLFVLSKHRYLLSAKAQLQLCPTIRADWRCRKPAHAAGLLLNCKLVRTTTNSNIHEHTAKCNNKRLTIMKWWLNYSRSLVAPRFVGSEFNSDCSISDLNPDITELLAASCRTWHRPRRAQWLYSKSAAWPKEAKSQDAAQRRSREKSMPNIRSSWTSSLT